MQITIRFLDWTGKADFTGDTANLIGADLQNANLRGADLQNANLRGADLRGAYLQGAYLRGADLRGADLQGTDLRDAYLQGAYLRGADLQNANLQNANLQSADLQNANLRGADLGGADLGGANLQNANLQSADLRGAYLQGAYLRDVKNAELSFARTVIVPEHGSFTGWKKCKGDVLVRVEIPACAKRSNAAGRKCRASHVKVLEIEGGHKSATSQYDYNTTYVVGKIVECHTWCDDRWQECAGGIHFFLTRVEAENY